MLKYHKNGTTNVTVYDGDQFEEHNAERQVGSSGSKADALNELLLKQELNPVCVDSYVSKAKLTGIRNRTTGLLLVIAAVDNDATRRMALDVLTESDRDFLFITPGNSDASDPETDMRGNVLWYGRVCDVPVGLSPALLFPNIEHPKDAIPREGSCLDGARSTPQLIASNALAAAYTLAVIQNFLDERMPFEASHLFFNGRTLSLSAN